MVRYSLTPQEHNIKRGLRRIQREIKQGIFLDIPIDYVGMFDDEFFIKLSNCKSKEGDGETLIINGDDIDVSNFEILSHEYSDGNTLFYLNNFVLKDLLDKYSLNLSDELKTLLLAVLPTSARMTSEEEFIQAQFKFFT